MATTDSVETLCLTASSSAARLQGKLRNLCLATKQRLMAKGCKTSGPQEPAGRNFGSLVRKAFARKDASTVLTATRHFVCLRRYLSNELEQIAWKMCLHAFLFQIF